MTGADKDAVYNQGFLRRITRLEKDNKSHQWRKDGGELNTAVHFPTSEQVEEQPFAYTLKKFCSWHRIRN
jgi:hypothetical protein